MRQITILIIGCLFFFGSGQLLHAQQYTGMSGLIHVPSGEMDEAGEARVGAHFLNKEHAGQRIQLRGEIQYVEPLSEYHSFLMAGNRLYLYFTERACNRQ